MAAQGADTFRLGDRLDEVLGQEATHDFLVEVMALSFQGLSQRLPPALVADEVRALLGRRLQGRNDELDELTEHAGLCHAIAQGLRDALVHGGERDTALANTLAARAKAWERQADHLVMKARSRAERHPQWQALVRLMEHSDDVADALEEACFVLSLLAEHANAKRPRAGWPPAVREALVGLAETVLTAVQDHIKALSVARGLGEGGDAADQDEFLAASWRVLQAEKLCDEGLRSARRALAQAGRERDDAVALTLGNELAAAMESASDALLALGHGLRERAFRRMEAAR